MSTESSNKETLRDLCLVGLILIAATVFAMLKITIIAYYTGVRESEELTDSHL